MEMFVVKCVDANNSSVLREGETYYAFPFGNGTAAYISRFPSKGSHTGSFQMNRFKIIEQQVEIETDVTNSPPVEIAELPNEETEVYHYAYRLNKSDEAYSTYGVALADNLIVLFKDVALTELIGTTQASNCEALQYLNRKVNARDYLECSRTINFSDLQGVPTLVEAEPLLPLKELSDDLEQVEKEVAEQLALF